MDPLSITTSAAALTAAVAKTMLALTNFSRTFRDAGSECRQISREPSDLSQMLNLLQNDATIQDESVVPRALQRQVKSTIDALLDDVESIEYSLEKYGGRIGRAKWAVEGKKEVLGCHVLLQAHKGSLNVVLGLVNVGLQPLAPLVSTHAARHAVSGGLNSSDLRGDMGLILAEIERLKVLISASGTGNSPAVPSNVSLEQWLDTLTSYAGSLCGNTPSLADCDETSTIRDLEPIRQPDIPAPIAEDLTEDLIDLTDSHEAAPSPPRIPSTRRPSVKKYPPSKDDAPPRAIDTTHLCTVSTSPEARSVSLPHAGSFKQVNWMDITTDRNYVAIGYLGGFAVYHLRREFWVFTTRLGKILGMGQASISHVQFLGAQNEYIGLLRDKKRAEIWKWGESGSKLLYSASVVDGFSFHPLASGIAGWDESADKMFYRCSALGRQPGTWIEKHSLQLSILQSPNTTQGSSHMSTAIDVVVLDSSVIIVLLATRGVGLTITRWSVSSEGGIRTLASVRDTAFIYRGLHPYVDGWAAAGMSRNKKYLATVWLSSHLSTERVPGIGWYSIKVHAVEEPFPDGEITKAMRIKGDGRVLQEGIRVSDDGHYLGLCVNYQLRPIARRARLAMRRIDFADFWAVIDVWDDDKATTVQAVSMVSWPFSNPGKECYFHEDPDWDKVAGERFRTWNADGSVKSHGNSLFPSRH
ncbi:hypothetical protein MKZ38_009341 [Zalerion maritima]|uniref:Fungal N-terminal domain-containing protein n=1 Tax=Zalerion maritima TaxID=339359 RepID=A0AAD5S1Q4_9PEZI|nr:hypothetical protein MKZ38_009341 [Zalerion maritima]